MSQSTHGAPCPLSQDCNAGKIQLSQMLSRRDWVKCFALGFVASSVGRYTTLADISPTANQANIISLNVESFPALKVDYGSVRVQLLTSSTTFNDSRLIITRAPGNVFYAVTARCTHQFSTAEPYDHSEGTRAIVCYTHGSTFDIEGNILSPADNTVTPLPKYNTSFANGILRVEVPSMNFKVNSFAVQSSGVTTRRALNFQRRAGGRYRVLYTPDLSTAPVPVDFATTSTGPLNRGPSFANQFFSNNTSPAGQTTVAQTLWVDSTADRGFYLVELLVTQEIAVIPA